MRTGPFRSAIPETRTLHSPNILNMQEKKLTVAQLRKLLPNRMLYIRCGDARFAVHKGSFLHTMKVLGKKIETLSVCYDERKVFIENIKQLQQKELFIN